MLARCPKNGTIESLLINRDLFIVNLVLRYTQLIRPMKDYACLLWSFAARTNVGRLKVLQST